MISLDKIRELKRSTVAIGLVKNGSVKPYQIFGTGFTIDKKGLIFTAKHVHDYCKQGQEYNKRVEKIETKIAMFRPLHNEKELDFETTLFKEFRHFDMVNTHPKFPLSDVDLAFGILQQVPPDLVELKIKKPTAGQLSITNEIAMCGYPSGKYTLDVSGEISGMRFSPIFQTGRIASLLPFDDAQNPYGIQTDIIGTGGSSGSPIVDNENTVIGIAQAVIPASLHEDANTVYVDTKYAFNKESLSLREVPTKTQSRILGHGSVGLTYGVTNQILYELSFIAKQFLVDGKIRDVKLSVTGLDFDYKLVA